jgi:cell division protein FtsB
LNNFHWDHKPFRRNAILAMALVILVLALHEFFGDHGYLALRRQQQEYNTLQQNIENLSKENQQLQHKIQSLKTNPETIEKQAREQLHLVRPGQLVYVLPKKQQAEPPAAAQNLPSK